MKIRPTTDFPKWQRVLDAKPFVVPENAPVLTPTGIVDAVKSAQAATDYFAYKPEAVDRWKTPDEFLRHLGGDCEDFAIYRMSALAGLGVPVERMAILVGKIGRGEVHAVLRVQVADGYALILDNMQQYALDDRLHRHRKLTAFKLRGAFYVDRVEDFGK